MYVLHTQKQVNNKNQLGVCDCVWIQNGIYTKQKNLAVLQMNDTTTLKQGMGRSDKSNFGKW